MSAPTQDRRRDRRRDTPAQDARRDAERIVARLRQHLVDAEHGGATVVRIEHIRDLLGGGAR